MVGTYLERRRERTMRHPLRWRPRAGVLLCVGLLMPVASAQGQKDQQPRLLLEEATKKEVVDGDLKGAIETYQRILKLEGVPRGVAARTLLHLGQCYEKLGTTEARNAYERIVREFADQSEEANLARGRLAALGGRDTAMRTRQVWTGPADDLLGAVTGDGRYLTLQDWPSENVGIRDLLTGQKRLLTHKDPNSHEFASLSVPSPDGRLVAYAWYNKESTTDLRLVGMDGSNPRVLAEDPEFPEAEPFDWSPDGKQVLTVFYKKRGGSRLALVSVADGAVHVLKTFELSGPKRARFSPDGRYVAYDIQQSAGSASYDVFALAVESGRESAIVRHPANDILFDWTPEGTRLLFGSDRAGTMGVWWVKVTGGEPGEAAEAVRPDIGQDVRPFGFTRDGSYYYRVRTNRSDVFLAELDFATGRVLSPPSLATQRLAGANSRPAWSPDGQKLLFHSRRGSGAGWGAAALSVRDTASGEVRGVPTRLETIARAGWFPDGQSLLAIVQTASSWPAQFRINVQTGDAEPIELFRVAGIGGAGWTRDGKTLFFQRWGSSGKGSAIVARDVATGQEREIHSLAGPAVYASSPMVSPDDRHVAVAVNEFDESRSRTVLVVSVAGGEARILVRDTRLPWPPAIAWAPGSRGVLFVKQPNADDPRTELWLVPLEGGEPRKLDLAARDMRDLAVHPDGRRLAYTSGDDRSEVWVMENFLSPAK
jgi:Tol biopolymer transport system component